MAVTNFLNKAASPMYQNVAEQPGRPPNVYTQPYDPRLPGPNSGVQYNASMI